MSKTPVKEILEYLRDQLESGNLEVTCEAEQMYDTVYVTWALPEELQWEHKVSCITEDGDITIVMIGDRTFHIDSMDEITEMQCDDDYNVTDIVDPML